MKKRWIGAIGCLILLAAVLCGCRGESYRDPIFYQQYPFTAQGILEIGGSCYEVTLSMHAPCRGSMTYHSPRSMEGVSLQYTDMGIVFSLSERQFALGEDDMPYTPLSRLCQAFSIGDRSGISYTHGGFVYGGVTYVCDSATGYPLRISSPDFTFTVTVYTTHENSAK